TSNCKTTESLIKELKELKLAKPLAVAKVKQGEFQIILSKIEDKIEYEKTLSIIPWGAKCFEYVLSSSKIVIQKEKIINHLWKNWEIKAMLVPIIIEDIFTGTYQLITNKKLNENQRKFEMDKIIFFINVSLAKRKSLSKRNGNR